METQITKDKFETIITENSHKYRMTVLFGSILTTQLMMSMINP